jgi:tetratricopeptide (TPR) repeat protein
METPLVRAAWEQRIEILRVLLQYGADPNFVSTNGDSAMSFTSKLYNQYKTYADNEAKNPKDLNNGYYTHQVARLKQVTDLLNNPPPRIVLPVKPAETSEIVSNEITPANVNAITSARPLVSEEKRVPEVVSPARASRAKVTPRVSPRPPREATRPPLGASAEESARLVERGDELMDSGKWFQALEAYKQAISISPGNAEAHVALGEAYNEMGMHGGAFAPLVRAIQLDPQNATAHYGIG